VVIAPQQMLRAHIPGEIPPIERVMSDQEILRMQYFLNESPALVERAREIARHCGAHVELRSARYCFDGSYVLISLAAADGDDVMELQQALEEEFRVPVRMRRVGTLQPTRLVGGLGTSGRKPHNLSHENEQYRKIQEDLPRLGQWVKTDCGEGMVVGLQVFRGIVTIRYRDGGLEMTHTVTDLHRERA
jgi:cell fate regulator YaaT (PSP1 superfamily)